MKFIDALKILGPAIMMAIPGAQPFIPLVIAGMHFAEESGQKGADKREIGKNAVKLTAQAANTIAKKEVVPEDQALAVYDQSVDTIVSVVNLVKEVKENK